MNTKSLLSVVAIVASIFTVGCKKLKPEPPPVAPTIIGRTYGFVGDKLSLKVLKLPQQAWGLRYFWHKEGESTPFHEGEKIDYIIKQPQIISVKAQNRSGVFSQESTDVNIDVIPKPTQITNTKYIEYKPEKLPAIEPKLIFSTTKFKDVVSFKVISPRAEKTYVHIRQDNGIGIAHHPVVIRKCLELNIGENLISLDLKVEDDIYDYKNNENRPLQLTIVVNDVVMSKYIYFD